MKVFFDRLKELKGNQTVAAFAKSIGIPQQSMDRYLKGRIPTLEVFKQLCLVYSVSSDWLLGLSTSSHGSATATGDHAQAVAGSNITITNSSVTPPECPDCASCKYKAFAAAFKAIQSPL